MRAKIAMLLTFLVAGCAAEPAVSPARAAGVSAPPAAATAPFEPAEALAQADAKETILFLEASLRAQDDPPPARTPDSD